MATFFNAIGNKIKNFPYSVMGPFSADDEYIKKKYAKEHGYTYDGTSFFTTDDAGNKKSIEIPDTDLAAAKDTINSQLRDQAFTQLGGTFDSANQALFSNNPRVNNQSSLTQGINKGWDASSDIMMKVNPMIGGAMKMGSFMSNTATAMGLGTDQMTTADKIFDSTAFKFTGAGLVNALGKSSTQDFTADKALMDELGGSYGGTTNDLIRAEGMAGKELGLFSSSKRRRMDRFISEMRRKEAVMRGISEENKDLQEYAASMGDAAIMGYNNQLSGGFDPRYVSSNKEGGTLVEMPTFIPEIIDAKSNLDSYKIGGSIYNTTQEKDEIAWEPEIIILPHMKVGGKVEQLLKAPKIEPSSQQNLIPEGALHKNKHHMDNAEHLTKKGIPVVDNGSQQQAEIEKEEIIFNKEVTQKLEELYRIYYDENSTDEEKDNAAISAGRLLTREIMLNTDDRTGLIDTLKHGGTLGDSIDTTSESEFKSEMDKDGFIAEII